MMRTVVLILVSWLWCVCVCVESSSLPPSCPSPPTAHSELLPILFPGILNQCALSSKPPCPPLEVTGDFIEKVLSSKRSNQHISVLFYTSWCPFSRNARSIFEVLSHMYPQVEHLAVEYSSTLPSLFSRYRIHSLPALLMLNETSLTRFHGSKDMTSFVKFYKETTGLEAADYISFDHQSDTLRTSGNFIMQSWVGASMDEIWRREPSLLLCTLFLFLRVVIHLFPKILHRLRAAWESYQPNLNLEIFGEARQMLDRIVHLLDMKRVWNKLKTGKSWNLRQGANNARVWASSFASVSLGETSRSSFAS